MLRNLSSHPFKAIQCMSGLLSQYFCSAGHVSFVKTLDPVSQMGPCQVECRVFMLPHPPILTMERLVGGVFNEQSTSLSHAWSLFSQSCAERALLQGNGPPGRGLTSLERCRNVLQGFPRDCLSKHNRDRGDTRKDRGAGTWTWVCIPALLFACLPLPRHHVDSVRLQQATVPTTEQLHPSTVVYLFTVCKKHTVVPGVFLLLP